MPHRICGDVFILRINALRCPSEPTQDSKFRNAIYEDVPEELLDTLLLKEMMQSLKWKVLPSHGNVVRLGFARAQAWAQMREKQEKERRKKEKSRSETAAMSQKKSKQMEIDTRKHEQREQRERLKWEMRERERRESARQDRERKERMTYKHQAASEVLVGLPYQ